MQPMILLLSFLFGLLFGCCIERSRTTPQCYTRYVPCQPQPVVCRCKPASRPPRSRPTDIHLLQKSRSTYRHML
ncbi:hypothetical protein J6590_056321 [Homalodisca vitripennis]|nr:hypothetical protein J6590_056321 [Homalodisca vitripennis]